MAITGTFSVAAAFLKQNSRLPTVDLFLNYAHYLVRSANAWQLPVPLERVRSEHGFQLHTGSLPSRGFLFEENIFVNSDDLLTTQRFTEAHEYMESLVAALRSENPSRISPKAWQEFEKDKEQWCEQGAAELLMPDDLFAPLVRQYGVSLNTARYLAELCHTSLTATTRKMIDTDYCDCIFAILREKHKKHEYVPSQVGQGVLWGNSSDWDPPAELRVWKRWNAPQVKEFLCINESFSRDGLAYQALTSGESGRVFVGEEVLDLEYIKGTYNLETMLVSIQNIPSVMALIRL